MARSIRIAPCFVDRITVRLEFDLALSPNIRGSLLMAVAMAAFTINDSITKAVSSEVNFGWYAACLRFC